jgi:hypothetical protein
MAGAGLVQDACSRFFWRSIPFVHCLIAASTKISLLGLPSSILLLSAE